MPDAIIEELWTVKDQIAREHEYDIDALVNHFQSMTRPAGQSTLDVREIEDEYRGASVSPE